MGLGPRAYPVNDATYYPPSLHPKYIGAHPPHDGFSADFGARWGYFQNYRNQTVSRYMTTPEKWSFEYHPYSAKPDLLAANKVRNYDRAHALPVNDISTIDAERMKEIDDMYKAVQLHREQYKDRTGVLHPLKYFKPDERSFQSPPSLLPGYLFKYPESYTTYKIPTVLPLTYERTAKTSYSPELALRGIYARGNCIAYKL